MSQDDLKKLIERLEIAAAEQPRKYLFKVSCVAILGYLYIFFVIALLLALLALLVWISLKWRLFFGSIQIVAGTVGGLYIILKSLNIKLEPPEGIPITFQNAPELWNLVTGLAISVQAPKIHKILLINEFNAAALEFPRFGIFGSYQNYVLIGLPLMMALSPEQFKAVIAHELGHISGQHSKVSSWIYRQRIIWMQIMAGLETSNPFAHFMFAHFCQWYAPFFNIYSYVLARRHEYDADKLSVLATSPKSAAAALVSTAVKAEYLDTEFWPQLSKMTIKQAEPPDNIISQVKTELSAAHYLENAAKHIKSVLAQETDPADTHPCMSDRLKAILSQSEEINPDNEDLIAELDCRQKNAAEEFLGPAAPQWEELLSKEWHKKNQEEWQLEYNRCQNALKELSRLEEKYKHNTLTNREKGEFVSLCTYYRGEEQGLALTEELARKEPDNAGIQHNLGLILLKKNIDQGIHHLELAMNMEPSRGYEVCSAISHYLRTNDRKDEAGKYDQKAQEYFVRLAMDHQERTRLTKADTFSPHDLHEETLSCMQAYFEKIAKIKQVYLVKKDLQEFPETPMYLLILDISHHFLELETQDNDQKLAEQVANANLIPDWHLVISMYLTTPGLRKMLKQPGALIFDRKPTGTKVSET